MNTAIEPAGRVTTIHDLEHRWPIVGPYEVTDHHTSVCWPPPFDLHAVDAVRAGHR